MYDGGDNAEDDDSDEDDSDEDEEDDLSLTLITYKPSLYRSCLDVMNRFSLFFWVILF